MPNAHNPKSECRTNSSHQEPTNGTAGQPTCGNPLEISSLGYKDGDSSDDRSDFQSFIGPLEWTAGRLLSLFRSNQPASIGHWDYCHNNLAPHLFYKNATVQAVHLAPPPLNTVREQRQANSEFRSLRHTGRESHDHRWLKYLAGRWLQEKGAKHIEYEGSYWSGMADVVSDDLQIAVECGNTDPCRIEAIFRGDHLAFMMVPYPVEDDLSATGYLFMTTIEGRIYGELCRQREFEIQRERMEAFARALDGAGAPDPVTAPREALEVR